MKLHPGKLLALALALSATPSVFATNGDNLMGIGPVSRSMGGTGIAAPQDAISAVFANPAAMCFTPQCNMRELDVALTLFMPEVNAEVDLGPAGKYAADGDSKIYPIPAIGFSMPLDPETRRWRMGLSAYGVSGLGVDYSGTELDGMLATPFPPPNNQVPLIQGAMTELMIMKFAPSLAYQVAPNFSVGAALHVDYAQLDLRNETSDSWGIGGQFGMLYRPVHNVSLGAVVTTPQSTNFGDVLNYNGTDRDLELESPTTIGVGVGLSTDDNRLVFAVDGKWLNWSDTAGYGDFDWKDQWVIGVGLQYAAIPNKLFLRCGYNYGENPLKENNGWGAGSRNVQGMEFPDYYYETFRGIGFPAIVGHHVTAGIGYAISQNFLVNIGYTHAFEETLTEEGSFMGMMPARISSTLSENSVEIGFSYRF